MSTDGKIGLSSVGQSFRPSVRPSATGSCDNSKGMNTFYVIDGCMEIMHVVFLFLVSPLLAELLALDVVKFNGFCNG